MIWGSKCLATLVGRDLADADADGVLAAEGPLGPPGGLSDGFEELFGGGEEFEPLASALGGEPRVAADDEPFAGEVVAGDFGEVPLVEQGGVHRFVGDESPDGGGAQGGDPAQPLDAGEILADAEVSMPRSPTRTRRAPKSRSLSTASSGRWCCLRRLRRRWGSLRGSTAARRRSGACPSCRRGCSRGGRGGNGFLPRRWR